MPDIALLGGRIADVGKRDIRQYALVALLTEAEFKSTISDPMRLIEAPVALPPGFWEYVDSIPSEDFAGHAAGAGISLARRDGTGRFDHVLLGIENKNVFMAIVIDVAKDAVHGHHLLDLNRVYGLDA